MELYPQMKKSGNFIRIAKSAYQAMHYYGEIRKPTIILILCLQLMWICDII